LHKLTGKIRAATKLYYETLFCQFHSHINTNLKHDSSELIKTLATDYSPTNCPICESPQSAKPYIVWKHLEWVKCPSCSGGALSPYTSEVEVKKEDTESTYLNYEKSLDLFMPVAGEKANWLVKNLEDGMEIVELGAGLGLVASIVREAKPAVGYHIIEPNKVFASFLRKRGLSVIEGSAAEVLPVLVEELSQKGKRILFFMDNVLEHIAYPAKLIKELMDISPPGSKILLEVPNEKLLKARYKLQDFIRGNKKPPTFPGHINLFTKKSLTMLCRHMGLSYKIWFNPLRSAAEVKYLTQERELNPLIYAALAIMRLTYIDYLLGVPYHLRAEIIFDEKNENSL